MYLPSLIAGATFSSHQDISQPTTCSRMPGTHRHQQPCFPSALASKSTSSRPRSMNCGPRSVTSIEDERCQRLPSQVHGGMATMGGMFNFLLPTNPTDLVEGEEKRDRGHDGVIKLGRRSNAQVAFPRSLPNMQATFSCQARPSRVKKPERNHLPDNEPVAFVPLPFSPRTT